MGTTIQDSWINHLRNSSRRNMSEDPISARTVTCPTCKQDLPAQLDEWRRHVKSSCSQYDIQWSSDAAITDAFSKLDMKSLDCPTAKWSTLPRSRSRRASQDNDPAKTLGDLGDDPYLETKRLISTSSSDTQMKGSPPFEFDSRYASAQSLPRRQLFHPDADSGASKPSRRPYQKPDNLPEVLDLPCPGPSTDTPEACRMHIDPNRPHMSPQTEAEPIPHEQLVAEVNEIYADLCRIESRCIEVNAAQSACTEPLLGSEQWQALIALHRTLLHEHHDFFLASQHPSASPALRQLAVKYAMPARMWRHGIHSFLELLRHRLPDSLNQMLTFIYMAYEMMALLYETVKAFEQRWVECLGGLAHYRMAIEEHNVKDREIWTDVARSGDTFASGKAPAIGRLYHRPSTLERPNAAQHLCADTKMLYVPIPFPSAKESIMTIFDPLSESAPTPMPRKCSWEPRTDDLKMFPGAQKIEFLRPLPEDFAMRGLVFVRDVLPAPWFRDSRVEDEENFLEPAPLQSILPTWSVHVCTAWIRPFCQSLERFSSIFVSFASTLGPLGLTALQARPIFAHKEGEEKTQTNAYKEDVPIWVYPAFFAAVILYVEGVGRFSRERRKWYLLAIAPSNLSFPWLVEHDRVSPALTASVFATAVYLACAFALFDYEELRPTPMYYIAATFLGLTISAAISCIGQSGSIASLNSGSGGNPFSVYLLFSMTLSLIICGRLLASYKEWEKSKAAIWQPAV